MSSTHAHSSVKKNSIGFRNVMVHSEYYFKMEVVLKVLMVLNVFNSVSIYFTSLFAIYMKVGFDGKFSGLRAVCSTLLMPCVAL